MSIPASTAIPSQNLSFAQRDLLGFWSSIGDASSGHDISTAPVITSDALRTVSASTLPSLGLLASVSSQHIEATSTHTAESALWLNLNTPFSALLCGVQGAGKSHALSVMLENSLLVNKDLGTLPEPLSALVFHYDTVIGAGSSRPCEAAYIAKLAKTGEASGIPVTVLVSPNCVKTMKSVYADLPVKIRPFQINTSDLTANRLLSLMQLDDNGRMPLYMSAVLAILRKMGSDNFSYPTFRKEVAILKLSDQQREMLNLRLELLDSFVKPGPAVKSLKSYCGQGRLVVVDLSDPFLDAATACSLFRLSMGMFLESEGNSKVGKVVVFDEAHKYLTTQASASDLTGDLLAMIRQQRHLGARFIISTQEPTVLPSSIIDLTSIVLAYRFSSPVWAAHLSKHVSAGKDADNAEWFHQVSILKTSQAILFSPSGYSLGADGRASRIGRGYLTVQMRKRITSDGGKSIMAVTPRAETVTLPSIDFFKTVQPAINRSVAEVFKPRVSATEQVDDSISTFIPTVAGDLSTSPEKPESSSSSVKTALSPLRKLKNMPSNKKMGSRDSIWASKDAPFQLVFNPTGRLILHQPHLLKT